MAAASVTSEITGDSRHIRVVSNVLSRSAMQQPFDTAAKALIDAVLSLVCDVAIQTPATPDAMHIDAVVTPRASRDALLQRGMLGQLAVEDCAFEVFAETPDRFDVDLCVARVLWLQAKARKARRLWVITPGVPRQAMTAWGIEKSPEWSAGVYEGRTRASPSIVVLPELEQTRSTLLLRLMGSGALLRAAINEARTLPADAWERGIINDLLLQMDRDLARMMRSDTNPSEDLQMRYEELKRINDAERAQWREEAWATGRADGLAVGLAEGRTEGREEGREEGRTEGRTEGLLDGERDALRIVIQARGWKLSEAHDALVRAASSAEPLRRWIARAAVAQHVDEVFDER